MRCHCEKLRHQAVAITTAEKLRPRCASSSSGSQEMQFLKMEATAKSIHLSLQEGSERRAEAARSFVSERVQCQSKTRTSCRM
eukprot:s3386_g6.t1